MAQIVKNISDNELLGEFIPEPSFGIHSQKNTPRNEPGKNTLLWSLNNKVAILERMSKNNTKLYNKGVIELKLTCIKCGRKTHVQITHANYHKLLMLHIATYKKEDRLANNIEIGNLMSGLKLSIPLIEVFYSQLCQRCISMIKCQRLGKNATNVEKNSL